MADIVGLLGSVLQLVDTVKKAREYVHTFRDAQKQRKLLLIEIESLEPLLRELDDRIRRSEAGGSTGGIRKFEEPLIRFRGAMERLAEKLQHDGSFDLVDRLTWSLWKKEDVEEELNVVERFKSSLTLGLELDIWDLAQGTPLCPHSRHHAHNEVPGTITTIEDAAQEQRIDHSYIFKSVRDIAQRQQQYFTATERETIITWYSLLNFFLRQADIFRSHQPGTCRWFLEMDTFKKWKSGVGKVLWCRGIPGAGKTVLVSIAVDHLRAEQQHDNIGVAVAYLSHRETDAHTPSTLLASLWRQLVVGQSIASVEKLYHEHREPGTKPTLDEDHAILCSTISHYFRVFVLIDALDEYPDSERGVLIWYLSQLGTNVSLMLTSRPHITLSDIDTAQLQVLEIEATEEDIRCHINAQIFKSPRLSKHIQNCPGLVERIEERIVRRSAGMFLMAKLHMDSIAGKHTVKAVHAALQNLPGDLEGTYDEIMERINRQSQDDRDLALHTLSWICNAQRPLRPSELRETLAVEPGTTELDPNNLLDMETILSPTLPSSPPSPARCCRGVLSSSLARAASCRQALSFSLPLWLPARRDRNDASPPPLDFEFFETTRDEIRRTRESRVLPACDKRLTQPSSNHRERLDLNGTCFHAASRSLSIFLSADTLWHRGKAQIAICSTPTRVSPLSRLAAHIDEAQGDSCPRRSLSTLVAPTAVPVRRSHRPPRLRARVLHPSPIAAARCSALLPIRLRLIACPLCFTHHLHVDVDALQPLSWRQSFPVHFVSAARP
ncbi:ANK-REP-REGION domain-containing protein [Mycena sanguinolenta]|uniref:ANK-REP-REGION domain-containing protein n=1 Tax=Mycena sanguinolenta TaxID=230812 RepID=A0A8H7CQC6_9AGAR|nr:ANK-REP-REGION domain-containing protein [Mycena sanguinolenta]